MPRAKQTTKRKSAARKQAKPTGKVSRPVRPPQSKYTQDYIEYLERYEMFGVGRPRLDPKEFDHLDDEYLDLLGLDTEGKLSDDQIVRLQELEYLLLESEQ